MTKTKEEISKGYDAIADRIGIDNDFYTRVLKMHGKFSGSVLDVGCGRGQLLNLTKKYSAPGTKFYGLDISEKLVQLARESNPGAEIIKGDAENLPYEDNMFDYVFMTECLEHLLDYQKALSEVSRVLKPNGIFIVTVPNRDWLQYDFYKPYIDRNEFQPVQDHYFRYNELKDFLKTCSLGILAVKGTDNLFYYGWKHKLEQVAAFIWPPLYKKMKRLIVKTRNLKVVEPGSQKPKLAFMTYAIDNRPGMGTGIVGRYSVEEFMKHRDMYDLTFIHFEKCNDPIYTHGVREVIMPEIKWKFLNFRSLRMIKYFLTTSDKFDCIQWFQPRLYPFFWLAPAKQIFVSIHGGGLWDNKNADLSLHMFNWTLRLFNKYVSMGTGGSNFARTDLLTKYKFDPEKVKLLHYGAEDKYYFPRSNGEVEVVRKKFNLPEKYLLNVARYVYEKNAYGVMKAYDQYMTKNPNCDVHLVNIGRPGDDTKRVMDLYNNSKFKDKIHLIESTLDRQTELPAIMTGAQALVFPLMHEGFGLPAIEAMMCGTPVVVAQTSYPEITNGWGVLVDAYDVDSIEEGIKKIVEDEENRVKIGKLGKEKAAKFTWENYQKGLVKYYEELLK